MVVDDSGDPDYDDQDEDPPYLLSRRKGRRDFLDEFEEEDEEVEESLARRRRRSDGRRSEDFGSRRTLRSPLGVQYREEERREWGSRRQLREDWGEGVGGSRRQLRDEWGEGMGNSRRQVSRSSSQAGYDRRASALTAASRRNSFQAADIPSPRYSIN